MGSITSDPAIYVPDVGYISSKIQHLAEIIKDFDPTLELRFIPPANRSSGDSLPYAIVHIVPDRKPYTVFYFGDLDDPVSVLARLFAGDSRNVDVMKAIETQEAAQKAFQYKEHMEELYEAADQMHFLMTSRSKNYVNWKDLKTGKIVKLDSNRRRVE